MHIKCMSCKKPIVWRDKYLARPVPYNLDGTRHCCHAQAESAEFDPGFKPDQECPYCGCEDDDNCNCGD